MKSLFLCALLLVFNAANALANDASLDWSGSPRLMNGTGSVAMESERVVLLVGAQHADVTCDFVFRNFGPACSVRMGFPDENLERQADPNAEVRSEFSFFRSFVNGREVKTTLVRGSKADDQNFIGPVFWHTKTVRFPAHSRVRVRDVYRVRLGSELNFFAQLANYTLHTGASWRGPIGRSSVEVRFVAPFKGSVRAASLRSFTGGKELFDHPTAVGRVNDFLRPLGSVVYQGPGTPTVRGRTLRWVKLNWKPTPKDNIRLYLRVKPRPNVP